MLDEVHEIIDRLAVNYIDKKDAVSTQEAHEVLDLIFCPEDEVTNMPDDWNEQTSDRDDDRCFLAFSFLYKID
ncbi:MAG: hypothetical protein K9L17_03435 [Clostridiales bacterium]|nr:hypothetical protein [Clostridiales bacterium]MCF8021732.1 hypothetical protein [Clostridiales bacterium]